MLGRPLGGVGMVGGEMQPQRGRTAHQRGDIVLGGNVGAAVVAREVEGESDVAVHVGPSLSACTRRACA